MHRWLANELDELPTAGRGRKINLVGPRGNAKSTLATLAHVLRAAIRGEPYTLIVSDTAHQAVAHLANVRAELEENEKITAEYPAAAPKKQFKDHRLTLANDSVIEAYGRGQRIRGKRSRAHRPSLIIADDLENDFHAISADARAKSAAWFHGTLLKAGSPRTNIVNVGTALHRDAIAMALTRTAGWRSRVFPAILTWPHRADLWAEWERIYCDVENKNAANDADAFYESRRAIMNAGATVLWPELEDLPTLMAMRAESGHTAFAREKQSQPIDPERCEFPEEYFLDHIWTDQLPAELVVRVLALDPSKGRDARTGDYSAWIRLGVDTNGLLYVDADMARRPTPKIIADGVRHVVEFNPNLVAIEATQFQELLAGEFAAALLAAGLGATPVAPVEQTAPKEMRIRRIGPMLSQRRLKFTTRNASNRILIEQMRDFPNGDHDDGPDALELAMRVAGELLHGRANNHDGLGSRLI